MDEKAVLQMIEAMDRKHGGKVVVFVHEYNNSYQEAVFRLAQLSAGGEVDFVPILFSWPSQAELGGYVSDGDAATYARDDLVQLLSSLSKGRPAGSVALAGHSMGGWLVMGALRQLRLQSRNDVVVAKFVFGSNSLLLWCAHRIGLWVTGNVVDLSRDDSAIRCLAASQGLKRTSSVVGIGGESCERPSNRLMYNYVRFHGAVFDELASTHREDWVVHIR